MVAPINILQYAFYCIWIFRHLAVGEFFTQTITTIAKNNILKEVQNITHQQCLHRCRLNPLCKDIAVVKEEGVCFLMKVEDGGGEMMQAKRISNTPVLVKKGKSTSEKSLIYF